MAAAKAVSERTFSKRAVPPKKREKAPRARARKAGDADAKQAKEGIPNRSSPKSAEAATSSVGGPKHRLNAKSKDTSLFTKPVSIATAWLRKKRSQLRKLAVVRNAKKCGDMLDWEIQVERIQARLSRFAIEERCIPGIGPTRAKSLQAHGFKTAYELQDPIGRMCLKEVPQISDTLARQLKAWSDHLAQQVRDEPIDRTSPAYHARLRKLKRERLRVRAK
jgi:hypothetical protein